MALQRHMGAGLPSCQSAGVHVQMRSQLFLGQTKLSATRDDAFAKCISASIIWIVAQKADDSWDEMQSWRGSVDLPVAHGLSGNAKLVSYFSLKQAQIQSSLPEMVAQSIQPVGIGRGTWFRTAQGDMAEWQRRGGPAVATGTR